MVSTSICLFPFFFHVGTKKTNITLMYIRYKILSTYYYDHCARRVDIG